MSKRVYIGRVSPAARSDDIAAHFKGFRIVDIRLMGGFGFVEFDTPREAEDAIRDFNGRDFMGDNLIVEFPRERRREQYDGGRMMTRPPPRRGVRVRVVGIPDNTSWQDLKDYGRIGNPNVMFADVDRNDRSMGIIEFMSMTDAEDAMHRLSGVDINNTPVRLEFANEDGASIGTARYDAPRGYASREYPRDAPRDHAPRDYPPRAYPPRDYPPRDYAPRDYRDAPQYPARDHVYDAPFREYNYARERSPPRNYLARYDDRRPY